MQYSLFSRCLCSRCGQSAFYSFFLRSALTSVCGVSFPELTVWWLISHQVPLTDGFLGWESSRRKPKKVSASRADWLGGMLCVCFDGKVKS